MPIVQGIFTCREQLAGAAEVVGEGAIRKLDGGILALPAHFQPLEAHDQGPGAGVLPRDTDLLLVDNLDPGHLK